MVISEEDAENLDLLSYNRFAGELYLHMIIYRVVAPVKDAQWLPLVADLYNMSSVADMNIDESRIPPFFIEIIGFIIFELFGKLGIQFKNYIKARFSDLAFFFYIRYNLKGYFRRR